MEWSDPSPARRNGKHLRSRLLHCMWVGQSMCRQNKSHSSMYILRSPHSSSPHPSSLCRNMKPRGPRSSRQTFGKTVSGEGEAAEAASCTKLSVPGEKRRAR